MSNSYSIIVRVPEPAPVYDKPSAATAAAVRASIERGDGDLEQIGATVRALLTQAWYAADCPPLDLFTESEV